VAIVALPRRHGLPTSVLEPGLLPGALDRQDGRMVRRVLTAVALIAVVQVPAGSLAATGALAPCVGGQSSSSASYPLQVALKNHRLPVVAEVQTLACSESSPPRFVSVDVARQAVRTGKRIRPAGPFKESVEIVQNGRRAEVSVSRRYRLRRAGPDCFAEPKGVETRRISGKRGLTYTQAGGIELFTTPGGKRC